MNFDFTQFNLDCPRMVIFIDEEWIPSSEPNEVWDRLVDVFGGDEIVAYRATHYCTQIPLATHYIQEVMDIQGIHINEHLLSHNYHVVTINSLSKTMEIKKDFVQSYIFGGEDYQIDHCTLKINYDPKYDIEYNLKWNYVVNNMRNSQKRSIILEDSSMFESFDSNFI